MIPMKNIVRTVAAGLLVCGFCVASAYPALADAPRNKSEAAVNGRKYYEDLDKKVDKARVAVNDCVIKYMPMDAEWMEGDHPFKPGDLFMCQSQLQSLEAAMDAMYSPDTPPLLWENSEQQEKNKRNLAVHKELMELYLAPNRYLINLVDTDPDVTGAIVQTTQLVSWSIQVTDRFQAKLKEMSSWIDKFKSSGDPVHLEPFAQILSYSNGNVKFTSAWENTLADMDRHTKTVLRDKRKIIDALFRAAEQILKMEADLKAREAALLSACDDPETKKGIQSVCKYLRDWTYKRAKYAFADLRFWAIECFDNRHKHGKIFSTQTVPSYAPNFEPVSSESYREMIKNALEYYVPNSVQIKQGAGVMVDGKMKLK